MKGKEEIRKDEVESLTFYESNIQTLLNETKINREL